MLHTRRTAGEQLKRVDAIGMCLFMLGLILLLMGLAWGGSSYPWNSAHVIATIVVGFFTLIGFVFFGNAPAQSSSNYSNLCSVANIHPPRQLCPQG